MPSRLIHPLSLTVREARLIEDELIDRRALMKVTDREDFIVGQEIYSVLRKIAEAMTGIDTKHSGTREKLTERMTAADIGIDAP